MLYISEKPFSYILKLDILDYIAVYICWDMNLKINVDNFCIFFFLGARDRFTSQISLSTKADPILWYHYVKNKVSLGSTLSSLCW